MGERADISPPATRTKRRGSITETPPAHDLGNAKCPERPRLSGHVDKSTVIPAYAFRMISQAPPSRMLTNARTAIESVGSRPSGQRVVATETDQQVTPAPPLS